MHNRDAQKYDFICPYGPNIRVLELHNILSQKDTKLLAANLILAALMVNKTKMGKNRRLYRPVKTNCSIMPTPPNPTPPHKNGGLRYGVVQSL